ncbi:MAG: ATP-dependent protease ATPase subunit HslU [Synergistaceae bacterium]|jgi:ATP-dependent HslUV protease ATP-binding subunit HslU|nr:ATP-dependent protease ATPase subunit HslU [Synergistaceae bacterium]
MPALIKDGNSLIPRAVVAYLDRYVVGQDAAKRAVAIALRNRIRRRVLPDEMRHEIAPKNILMVGPTGVGKTEIARRLAKLVEAPFVKVEATKFTEVGYVGRDVESMIRDLVEASVQMVRRRKIDDLQNMAEERAEDRLLDVLLPGQKKERPSPPNVSEIMKLFGVFPDEGDEVCASEGADKDTLQEDEERSSHTRDKMREMLRAGKLDMREVDIEVAESPKMGMNIIGGGMEEMGINIGEILGGMMPKKLRRKRMRVDEAKRILRAEEAEKLLDIEQISKEALDKAQEEGIVFIDEIDKIATGGQSGRSGPDVSREGVQRDLLPIIEGSTVQTKYGTVHTDHILFIAAGAFHQNKPSDLAPELQGRLPIRVELGPLSEADLVRILTEPENSLIKQYVALIGTEGIDLIFTDESVASIAKYATEMNAQMENIGARRLHAMMEHLLEEISFDAGENNAGEPIEIDAEFVRGRLESLVEDSDARKYLL